MGKIKINGSAKKEFKADVMRVDISISTAGETSASAINKGKKETEKVLQLLVDLGFELSKVSMEKDRVSNPSRYDDDKYYHFEKEISFTSSANLALLESISDGLIKHDINATYDETFYLSNIESAKKAVLQDALLDSKKKAEIIAETLGQKLVGIESAKCDEYREDTENEMLYMCCEQERSVSLATMLSPDTISVDKSIDVTWIIE